jgi:hypothetical protein
VKLGQPVHDPEDPYYCGVITKIDVSGGVWIKVLGSLKKIARPKSGIPAQYRGQPRHKEIKGMRFRARQFGLQLHDYIDQTRP